MGELLLVLAAWLLLSLVESGLHPAFAAAALNAHGIQRLESLTGLVHVEHLAQLLVLPGWLGSALYVGLHFGLTPLVMLWLYARHRSVWLTQRRVLAVTIGVCVVVCAVYPVAPPWMLGAHDATVWAHPAGSAVGLDLFAAFPSLHAAVALWVALAARDAGQGRWVLFYPALVALVVVATGNHYLLDVLAGCSVLLAVRRVDAWALRLSRGGESQWLLTPQPCPLSRRRLARSRTP